MYKEDVYNKAEDHEQAAFYCGLRVGFENSIQKLEEILKDNK